MEVSIENQMSATMAIGHREERTNTLTKSQSQPASGNDFFTSMLSSRVGYQNRAGFVSFWVPCVAASYMFSSPLAKASTGIAMRD